MSTANKLTYLNTTKQNLKTVINTTGAGLTDSSTFRSYANVLNDKILGAINGEVDLFEEYPKVSGNGTDLSLNGVVEGKMSITPQGVSKQGSTTGKNLLNVESDLEFTRSKTLQVNIPAGTYHITNNGTTASDDSNRVTIRFNDNNKTYNLSVSNDYSVTLTSEETIIYLYSHTDYPSSAGVSATIKDLMLSVDGGAYEPYTGGIPAPNPSYPYPVKSVTGDNILVISNSDNSESQTYPISLGNIELNSTPDGTIRDVVYGSSDVSYNLFDKNNANILNAGITSSTIYSSDNLRTLYMPIVGGKTYTISKILSSRFRIGTTRSIPIINTPIYNYINADSNKYQTISTTSEDEYLCVYYYLNGTDTLTEQEILDSIQITEGSEAKPYAPYGQVGMWWKREYIGKVVLNGSENWENRPSYQYADRFVLGAVMRDLTQNDMLINNFKYANDNPNTYPYLAKSGGQCVINYSEFGSTTLEQFKEWLTTHNTIVYGTRVTPTDIPITDTTLINQLNDIYNNAHSYNGVTNITTTYEDGNEQMYLDIEALKNVWDTSL